MSKPKTAARWVFAIILLPITPLVVVMFAFIALPLWLTNDESFIETFKDVIGD